MTDWDETAVAIVCDERVPMALSGPDRIEAIRRLTALGLGPVAIGALLKTRRNIVSALQSNHRIAKRGR